MNQIEELERNLIVAYLNYEIDDLSQTLKYLDRMLNDILTNDESLNDDLYWKKLTIYVFKAAILNNFYNKKEMKGNDLDALLANQDEMKKNVLEFCINFKENPLIDFISYIENITDESLKSVRKIIMFNIGKMNMKSVEVKTDKEIENNIKNYLTKNYKMSQKRVDESYEKLCRHIDILNEFYFLTQKNYFKSDNPITVEGYTAHDLYMSKNLSELGAYNYLIYLRENPEEALKDLKNNLPNKDSTYVLKYIVEVTRDNYAKLTWNEDVKFMYRGLTIKCDHEYDAGTYMMWLDLPKGVNYKIGKDGKGDVPYKHQFMSGYMFGDCQDPHFASTMEEIMDYVDEYYEYFKPFI